MNGQGSGGQLAGLAVLALGAIQGTAQTTDDLFDDGALHEIRLTMHPADWLKLRSEPQSNSYYPCDIGWRGLLVRNAGARSRGAASRNDQKPGLRVDIDRFEDQQFAGLKSFILKPSVQDASQLRERLSMAFLRRMGLPAPRESHARLYVNDEYAGLYTLVESVDKRFLRRNFGEDGGYLYEFRSADDYRFDYLGPDPALYSPRFFKPVTREKDPDPAPIESMIRTIHFSTDAEFAQAMSAYLDMELFMAQVAIDIYLGEVGGILGANNFYFYRLRDRQVSRFIAWDKDGALQYELPLFWQSGRENVLLLRALGVSSLRQAYFEALARSAAVSGGAGGWMEQEVIRIYEQIRTAALEDPNKQCLDHEGRLKPCSNEDFEAGVERVRRFARERGESIRAESAQAGYEPGPEAPQLYEGAADLASGSSVLQPGAMASLYGKNLGGQVIVHVNGFPAIAEPVSDTQVTIRTPEEAGTGRMPLTAIVDGRPSNTIWVEVAPQRQ